MTQTAIDVAFLDVTLGTSAGVVAWRIVSMAPQRLSHADLTTKPLFSGDCYLFLHSFPLSQHSTSLQHNLFYLIGSESSQDERGVVAIKARELDDALGGSPTQYREVEGSESAAFHAMFRSLGIPLRYAPGGADSAFRNTAELKKQPLRLFQVKGVHNPRIAQLKSASRSLLNSGDVFVLDSGDAGEHVFLFIGSSANRWEKATGLQFAVTIRNEDRKGKGSVEVVEQAADPSSDAIAQKFWNLLEGGYGPIAEATNDEEASSSASEAKNVTLYMLNEGEWVKLDTARKLQQSMLDSSHIFLVEAGTQQFLWIGKQTQQSERRAAMELATTFVNNSSLCRINQYTETPVFKSCFVSWANPVLADKPSAGKVSPSKAAETNNDALYNNLSRGNDDDALKAFDIAPGTQKVRVQRVEQFKPVDVPDNQYGIFYSDDAYLVHLTYECPGSRRQHHVIYYWQGAGSSQDERGASALLARELDDSLGGSAVQIRVLEGKEPVHLVSLFKHFIVLWGGVASGFRSVNAQENNNKPSYNADGNALFLVKSTRADITRAFQTEFSASSLCSDDAFVVQTPSHFYVWLGKGASAAERSSAPGIATFLATLSPSSASRQTVVVEERSEPEALWEALGGKTTYLESRQADTHDVEPRLLYCKWIGRLLVEDIVCFAQSDLHSDECYILDVGSTLFVWMGNMSEPDERAATLKFADTYLVRSRGEGHRDEVSIVTVREGSEPRLFTSNFPVWRVSEHKGAWVDPYEEKLRQLENEKKAAEQKRQAEDKKKFEVHETAKKQAEEPAPKKAETAPAASTVSTAGGKVVIPYEKLRTDSGVPLPDGLDASSRQNYLSDAEFVQVLGMPRDEFDALKLWRQQAIKKEKKLF